jgi:hypothetical protein
MDRVTIEDVRDTLRAHVRQVSDVLWELDSATSLKNKAAKGYRSSERTGDAPWNVDRYVQREAVAALAALRLLRQLRLAPDLTEGPFVIASEIVTDHAAQIRNLADR